MNKHSVSHKIHGKQIFVKDRDEERQKKTKEQNMTYAPERRPLTQTERILSLSLCAQYIILLFQQHDSSLENPFSFTWFCSDAVAVIRHSPQRRLSIMRLFFFLIGRIWRERFFSKQNEAWTILRRDEGKIGKKGQKSNYYRGNSRDGGTNGSTRYLKKKLYKLGHRVVCSCSLCVDVFWTEIKQHVRRNTICSLFFLRLSGSIYVFLLLRIQTAWHTRTHFLRIK